MECYRLPLPACKDYSHLFAESIKSHGDAPPPPERYTQERALFGFFINGIAVLESTYYGCNAIGALLLPAAFPLSTDAERRQATPENTRDRFEKEFPHEDLTKAMKVVLNDPQHSEWREIRNILAHRVAPGRVIYGSTSSGAPPAIWKLKNIQIKLEVTGHREQWLTESLTRLIVSAEKFSARHIK